CSGWVPFWLARWSPFGLTFTGVLAKLCSDDFGAFRSGLDSTNGLERLNREVRRRERVIGIFPNVASALRLLGALLMEQDEEWTTGRCYLRMDEYWQWKKAKDEASGEKTMSEGD